jgi:hypothetical protein
LPDRVWLAQLTPAYAEYLCGRVAVYRRLKPASFDSPCYLFVKPGLLAVCVMPHQYLSGPAVSPPTSICRQLRPKDTPIACTTDGVSSQSCSPIPILRLVAHFQGSLPRSWQGTLRRSLGGGYPSNPTALCGSRSRGGVLQVYSLQPFLRYMTTTGFGSIRHMHLILCFDRRLAGDQSPP